MAFDASRAVPESDGYNDAGFRVVRAILKWRSIHITMVLRYGKYYTKGYMKNTNYVY